ncbi:MAG TPA: hypothetical protein VJ692_11500 [Nitrospiraceae bacterium]|nr:hypothetical protein [Nitrospiraceae bacterium]
MRSHIVLGSFALIAAVGLTSAGCSESTMERREAKPAMSERMSNEAVKGQLIRTDGDYLWIREDGGKEVRVHVDDRTKMDKVVPGDKVKAYITENGHATTVQRM